MQVPNVAKPRYLYNTRTQESSWDDHIDTGKLLNKKRKFFNEVIVYKNKK